MKEFSSFGGFATLLTGLAAGVAMEAVTHHVLEDLAETIETRAKEKIGEYQPAAGPFEAWQPLAEATKDDRVAQGYPADQPLLRTGGLRDSIEHVVHGNVAEIGSNADEAVYQELGTATIPPRSFLGGAAFEEVPKALPSIANHYGAFLTGTAMHRAKRIL